MPDACFEGQQFLAFRGSLPAKREALPGFPLASRQTLRELWDPQYLVTPFETLGTTTSRHTLRDSGNHYISSHPSRLWNHYISSDPARILGSTISRHTLRDSGNHYISSHPSRLWNHYISSHPARLWEPLHLVGPYETLGTVTSRRTLLLLSTKLGPTVPVNIGPTLE
jgi:hypothetical protein